MPASLAKKVLLIGWDAADWKAINPLLDAGEMPNLERLVSQGVMGNLATLYPMLSPMLWTSIATGKRPYKHGIHGFSEPDPHTGRIRPITNLNRQTKAIWNILNQNGKRCNVVGWWPSHPAEPIKGVMLSNHYQQAHGKLEDPWPMRPGTVHPQRLEEPLKELRIHPWELEAEHLLPFVPRAAEIDQEKDKRLLSLAKIIAECTSLHAAATGIIQLEPWDFMAVYYDAIDHFGHGFMKYHPPRQDWIPEADYEMYKEVVAGGYKYHDMMLGVLLALAGEETTVILMSDHGFHPDHLRPRQIPNEPAGPAAEHREYGIFVMKGPGIRSDERIYGATLLDVAPTILRLFGLPVGRDMDGKALAASFEQPPEIEYIDSWDQVAGDAGQHPADARIDPVEAQEALDQLVELGYIDQPDADQEVAVAETVRELKHNLARSYMDGNLHGEAAPLFEDLWNRWPDEQRFGVQLLQCQLAMEQTGPARSTLDLIIERKKQYAVAAAEELKQLTEELKDKKPEELDRQQQQRLRKLRARAGTNLPAVAYLTALVLHAEGRSADALAALDEAQAAQMHNRPSVYLKRGEILLDLKRWADAEACFEQVLEMDPINAAAHLGLCRSYLPRRRNRLAAEEALAAIGLQYHNPRGHYLHGVALHRCGHVEIALQALHMAVAQNPNFPDAHRRLALIYGKRLGDREKAAEHRRLMAEAKRRIRDYQRGIGRAENGRPAQVQDAAAMTTETAAQVTKPRLTAAPAEIITIVSGLPRSGTSMMMQMLAAGGMPIMSDAARTADQNNPRGYHELEKVKSLRKDRGWLAEARGQALKIIAQLLPYLAPELPYRIIFMDRDMEEIIASQSSMLERAGKDSAGSTRPALAKTFRQQLSRVKQMVIDHPNMEMLTVNYGDVIALPGEIAQQVAEFLDGFELDVAAMRAAVKPELYREKAAGKKVASD